MDKITHLKQLFARAQQFLAEKNYRQAAAAYRQATELDADSFAAWCNLSATLFELSQTSEAADAARKALALKPDFGPAWANLGDALRLTKGQAEASFEAYRRAAALMPRSPEILTKLGAALQVRSQFSDAVATLQRALSLAPAYREARINLCSTLMSLGRVEDVRSVMAQGARLAQDPAIHAEWHSALELLEQNLRLRPVLANAVTQGKPELVVAAVHDAGRSRPVDEALVETIMLGLQRGDQATAAFSAWRPEQAATLYAVEAHFSAHLGETVEAVATTRGMLAAAGLRGLQGEEYSAEQRDALQYYSLCHNFAGNHGSPPCEASDVAARLRFLHAYLALHRPEITPGQFKVVPNSVTMNPSVIRTPPAQIPGTIEAIYRRCYLNAEPGPLRASLVYFAIADMHPFPDGNGRLARWLMNRELQSAGLSPVVYAANMKAPFHKALWAIRRDHDFGPFVAWLADCDAYTGDIVRQLGA